MKAHLKLYFLLFCLILLTSCSSKNISESSTAPPIHKTLSGKWFGPIKFEDNIKDPKCSYEGIMHIVLDESTEDIQGIFFINITDIVVSKGICLPPGPSPPQLLNGNAQSGKIMLITENNWMEFKGKYTLEKISLEFESCHDQICADGTKGIGSIGKINLERLNS